MKKITVISGGKDKTKLRTVEEHHVPPKASQGTASKEAHVTTPGEIREILEECFSPLAAQLIDAQKDIEELKRLNRKLLKLLKEHYAKDRT